MSFDEGSKAPSASTQPAPVAVARALGAEQAPDYCRSCAGPGPCLANGAGDFAMSRFAFARLRGIGLG